MFNQLFHHLTNVAIPNLNGLLLLGVILFAGTIGGRAFQRFKIPQVVGYVTTGILLGQSGFKIIDKNMIQVLIPFSYFALGLIGFMIGGELKKESFRRYGKQFTIILLAEGLGAFIAVSLLLGLLGNFFLPKGANYWALALLLGAISSATAPAATVDVLWEYKTAGPLTSMVLGIVAMDDGLALVLFAFASSIAARMLGNQSTGLFSSIISPFYEIGIALLIGTIIGLILIKMLRKYHTQRDKIIIFSLSTILFALGLSLLIKINMLLTVMTIGAILVNFEPYLSKDVFTLTSGFASPFYILFFVLVGASLNISYLSFGIIAIAVVYVLGRSAGKMLGAMFGAKISGAGNAVTKYLPFCLFSQAGVAIGLSILAYNIFPAEIGNYIVAVVTLSTFVVQLLGPPSVKYAVVKAGEVGLDVTEEDLMDKFTIYEVMDKKPPLIFKDTPLKGILDTFANSDYNNYPVGDKDARLSGIITAESIRTAFKYTDLEHLVVAEDILEPVITHKIKPQDSLRKANECMDRYNLEYLLIVSSESKIIGFIEKRMINKFISARLIEVRQKIKSLEE